jgi:hypothetical protein
MNLERERGKKKSVLNNLCGDYANTYRFNFVSALFNISNLIGEKIITQATLKRIIIILSGV